MYLSEIRISNFRQLGGEGVPFVLELQPGITALVGENDSGKSAVVDAIRYALLTRDVDYIRVRLDDFYVNAAGEPAAEMVIRCKLSGLSDKEKSDFPEQLTYDKGDGAALYVYWRARRLGEPGSRRLAEVSVRSGPEGAGPGFESPARDLLQAAYLRPLRDAEQEMSAGQGSRLSQVLSTFPSIRKGTPFDQAKMPEDAGEAQGLSLSGMAEYFRYLVNQHDGVRGAQQVINNEYLSELGLAGAGLHGHLNYTQAVTESARLRQILERLELELLGSGSGTRRGRYGLGSNNLLFMACELLLLGSEPEGLPLLLVEEPEAHLHPQRQLRLMEFLTAAVRRKEDGGHGVQVILTTHSPNLSSKVPLDSLVLLENQQAFPLRKGETRLGEGDYRFLQRFLDSTKANLFFARGVIIVEGDAEAILIPTLARLIGCDLTAAGVSIVNVGSTGLRRYARILQRAGSDGVGISIPVACLADMDVMPDCAPQILGLVEGPEDPKWGNPKRRWKSKRDFGDQKTSQDEALAARRNGLAAGNGANIRTFTADAWTFEYDLAFSGLAEEVYVAAALAKQDDAINNGRKTRDTVEAEARTAFQGLQEQHPVDKESLCAAVYQPFHDRTASKAIAAQYLAEILEKRFKTGETAEPSSGLAKLLPAYVTDAIMYAARVQVPSASADL
jgi:putative ATP-dependent endonuclease of the OLD family